MTNFKLGDPFTSPTGEFSNYFDETQTSIISGKHYDLRSFHANTIMIANSMINLRNTNAFAFDGVTMETLDSETPSIKQDSENWESDGPSITVGPDASYGQQNVLGVPLTNGVTSTVTSTYVDDIFTDFQDATYAIHLELLSFPAQSDGIHLDLAGSFIDFTSDPTYATLTDSFSFDQSVNDLTGGGDVTWEIPVSDLVTCDPANIVGIRLRLLANGDMTFKATAMRVYASDNSDYISSDADIRIDTKSNWVYKRFPQAGSDSGTPTPMILVDGSKSRPKNVSVVAKFMPGIDLSTLSDPADNTLTLFARYYEFPVEGTVKWDSDETILTMSNIGGSFYTETFGPLSDNTEYFLVFDVYKRELRLSIWDSIGAFFKDLIFTSNWQTT